MFNYKEFYLIEQRGIDKVTLGGILAIFKTVLADWRTCGQVHSAWGRDGDNKGQSRCSSPHFLKDIFSYFIILIYH
jgi:hypothetical protein